MNNYAEKINYLSNIISTELNEVLDTPLKQDIFENSIKHGLLKIIEFENYFKEDIDMNSIDPDVLDEISYGLHEGLCECVGMYHSNDVDSVDSYNLRLSTMDFYDLQTNEQERYKIPTKAYTGDLGYDLYSDEDIEIEYGSTKVVSTNIAIAFPAGWGGFIKDRSGVATKQKLHTVAGVIDNQYRGNVGIAMINDNNDLDENGEFNPVVKINKGDKIAQLVPIMETNFKIQEVDEFEDTTDRGENRYGSSGNN